MPIKSDQNGIERLWLDERKQMCTNDKIRPKWDWKLVNKVIHFVVKLKIKSDQNGIESIEDPEGVVTKEEIKSDQNGIESLL